jgi:DNA-binding response OmpR family regulator
LSEGADDYLPKPFSPAELVLRVKTILRRTEKPTGSPASLGAGEVLALGDLVLDPDRHRVAVAGADIGLSGVELRLLAALLDADGRVLSRLQLLDAVYGEAEGDVTDRAIDQYVKRLREKLGDDPATPRYVETVRGTGYRAAGRVTRHRDAP